MVIHLHKLKVTLALFSVHECHTVVNVTAVISCARCLHTVDKVDHCLGHSIHHDLAPAFQSAYHNRLGQTILANNLYAKIHPPLDSSDCDMRGS